MKRVRQIILFLVLIVLCGGYAFWRSGLHLSPEAAMHAEERGLRYGPSEEILLTYEKENGNQVYVGRWEKGLSVVCVERKWGIFWKAAALESGYAYYLSIGEGLEAFPIDGNRIVGLSYLPEVTEVTCELYLDDESLREDISVQEMIMDVAKDGFFFGKLNVPEGENWDDCRIGYLEGRTQTGETVFVWDENA